MSGTFLSVTDESSGKYKKPQSVVSLDSLGIIPGFKLWLLKWNYWSPTGLMQSVELLHKDFEISCLPHNIIAILVGFER